MTRRPDQREDSPVAEAAALLSDRDATVNAAHATLLAERVTVDPATARAAVRTVLDRAQGPEDARALIGALGLTGALRAYESAPPSEAPTPRLTAHDERPAGPQPCDVCGLPVTAAYIARTGRARHANHPEGA